MPDMHLRQPQFTYSACRPFTKKKERIQKFKKAGNTKYIYRNELFTELSCFQHDMAYGDFKDLAKRTAADKVLRDKAFNIDKDLKYDEYQLGLAFLVYKFFDEKTKGSRLSHTNKSTPQNEQFAEEFHKPIIRKFKREECIQHLRTISGVLI